MKPVCIHTINTKQVFIQTFKAGGEGTLRIKEKKNCLWNYSTQYESQTFASVLKTLFKSKKKKVKMACNMEHIVRKGLHPIFSKTYALNKSQSKRINVGLEYGDNTLNLEPAVRLCDKDSQGIKINLDEWSHFKTLLENID